MWQSMAASAMGISKFNEIQLLKDSIQPKNLTLLVPENGNGFANRYAMPMAWVIQKTDSSQETMLKKKIVRPED